MELAAWRAQRGHILIVLGTLKLNRTNEKGLQEQVTLKWKDNTPGAQALETAKPGSQLTVEANDSPGAWEVASVISGDQMGVPEPAGQAAPGAGASGSSRRY